MKKRIAINGFGRIGRLTARFVLQHPQLELVAINDLSPTSILAHLFKYDTSHGIWPKAIQVFPDRLLFEEQLVQVFSSARPEDLPWKSLGVDIVIECTGKFTDRRGAEQHLTAGARHVILSAPAKDKDIPTVVLGINDHILETAPTIVSNASCTTNCLAPMVKVLDDNFGIMQGCMNTVHAYTADQSLQDGGHSDLRRARAAAVSIIPTTTGAAKAIGEVIPHLQGKLDGMATRVPVVNGSLIDFTALLKRSVTVEEINLAMRGASERSPLQGLLQYSEEPLVSVDIIGNLHSCVFDALLTKTQDTLVKVIGWYDNEAAYSKRLVDITLKLPMDGS